MLVWSGATALSAAASVAFAAAQQGVERHVLTRVATYVFGILGVGALFSVVGVAAGWFSLSLSDNVGIEVGVIMIVASALVLLVSAVLAARRLGQIRRTRLLSGGALVSGISGAFLRPGRWPRPRHRCRAARHRARPRAPQTRQGIGT